MSEKLRIWEIRFMEDAGVLNPALFGYRARNFPRDVEATLLEWPW